LDGVLSPYKEVFDDQVDEEKCERPGKYFQQALFCFACFGDVALPPAVAVRAAEANDRVDQAQGSVDRAAVYSAEVGSAFGAERHELSFYRR